jgi:hypothetical protein
MEDENRFFEFIIIIVAVVFFALLFMASKLLHVDTIVSMYDNANASAGPLQLSCDCEPFEMTIRDVSCKVLPLAYYNISGKVLGTKRYDTGSIFDKADERVNPFDIVIGWGPLLDDELGQKVSLVMTGKSIKIRASQEFDYLKGYASNNHIILENPDQYEFFLDLNKGDLVSISGRLVNMECGSYSIESSLRRTDSASESILVSHAEKIN